MMRALVATGAAVALLATLTACQCPPKKAPAAKPMVAKVAPKPAPAPAAKPAPKPAPKRDMVVRERKVERVAAAPRRRAPERKVDPCAVRRDGWRNPNRVWWDGCYRSEADRDMGRLRDEMDPYCDNCFERHPY